MQIRQGNARDWPFIYNLAKEAIPHSISPWRRQPLADTMKYREQILKGLWNWIEQTNSLVFIAERKAEITGANQPAGYLILYPGAQEELTGLGQAWIMDIAVKPKWRSQGVGRALLEAAESYCRDKNILYLGLAVSSHNVQALRLYEHFGFVEERRLMVKIVE